MSEKDEHRREGSSQDLLSPPYTHPMDTGEMPGDRLPEHGAMPDVARRLIEDQLMLDGNARLNLATFVSTWMEPQARSLIDASLDKNLVDRDEYPAMAELERRCINIVADLFHAPAIDGDATGVSTVGSSEAVMLAGMAMKWRWRQRRKDAGKDAAKPNLVLGTNVQVVWQKFCRYWEVEPRYVPVPADAYAITPADVVAAVDDDTIGVVATMGTTYTGEYEPISAIHDALAAANKAHGRFVPIHVDAATGGFVAPFLDPDIDWDFRLPGVRSINVSGHKYGLVYPGIGFVVFREEQDRPEDLVFHVDYLGGEMPTYTLNFSRPGSHVVAQYYNFIRLGHTGYRRIMQALRAVADELADRIPRIGPFEIVGRGRGIPVITFQVQDDQPYNAFDLSDRLRYNGWQVPAYSMPENAADQVVARIVVREGFTRHLASSLTGDLLSAHRHLVENPPRRSAERSGYRH